MAHPDIEQLRAALAAVEAPGGGDLVTAGALDNLALADGRIEVDLVFPYPCAGMHADLTGRIQALLGPMADGAEVAVTIRHDIPATPRRGATPAVTGVKNIIAVASGKGGVGKSTTAVNLALALDREGARVGLLDADIYGPSQAIMLGLPAGTRPEVKTIQGEQMFVPVKAHGIQAMSMGFLATEKTPMVWRGPMVSGALQQLLTLTMWEALDYLIVDMPPGTGDIQLTLSQKVPVSGAVIVTTPQDIALADGRKGVEMFRQVDIPVLGVVENMSIFLCPNCGHAEHLFGAGGGLRIAEEYGVELLGALPLDPGIRERADSGEPTVASEPDSNVAAIYRSIARTVAARLAQRVAAGGSGPTIVIDED